MTSKRVAKIVGLCLCVLLMLIGFYVHSRLLRPRFAFIGHTEDICERIATLLKQYYAESGITVKEPRKPQVSDVIKFIESHRLSPHGLSYQAPIAPYPSPSYDFGIYLLLPEKLESDLPVLIGYTTPRSSIKKNLFRIALFLRGSDIIVVPLPSQIMEEIIGAETVKQAKPDLYYHR